MPIFVNLYWYFRHLYMICVHSTELTFIKMNKWCLFTVSCTAYQQLQLPKNVRKPSRWLIHSWYGISYSYMDPIIWLQFSIDLAVTVSPNESKYLFRFRNFIRKWFWSDNFWLFISNWFVAGGFVCSFFWNSNKILKRK